MGTSVTNEERGAISAEFVPTSTGEDDCAWCKRQISSARKIAHPDAMLCDNCAKADSHEEER